MNNAVTKITVLSFLITTMMASMSYASTTSIAPIEGGNDKVVKSNKQTLKSVIKLGFAEDHINTDTGKFEEDHRGSCTGALVSKNILLTARHCTYQDAQPAANGESAVEARELVKKGGPIFLNGNGKFEVVDVIRYATIYTGTGADETLTDVALILVKSTAKSNFLDKLPLLPIATAEQEKNLTKQILVSGYGLTDWKNEEASKTLKGGIADRINTTEEMVKLLEGAKLHEQAATIGKGEFNIAGGRVEQAMTEYKKGKNFIETLKSQQPKESETFDHRPLVLQGDSGSPAIAFDHHAKPYIVGVASQAARQIVVTEQIFELRDSKGKTVVGAKALQGSNDAENQQVLEASLKWLVKELAERKWIDETGKILESFSVVQSAPRVGMGIYASVTNESNQTFITQSLSTLENLRDGK